MTAWPALNSSPQAGGLMMQQHDNSERRAAPSAKAGRLRAPESVTGINSRAAGFESPLSEWAGDVVLLAR